VTGYCFPCGLHLPAKARAACRWLHADSDRAARAQAAATCRLCRHARAGLWVHDVRRPGAAIRVQRAWRSWRRRGPRTPADVPVPEDADENW